MNSSNNITVDINNEIYGAAINFDKNKLIQLQEKYGTLDIKCDGFTVGGRLGKEGKIDVAQFLHNYFNINLDDVIYGVAAGNKTDLLQHALFQGLNVFSNKVLILIAGYARGNHLDEMQKTINQEIDKIKANKWDFNCNLHNIIRAPMQDLARNGQFPLIDSLINLGFETGKTSFDISSTLMDRAHGATLQPNVCFEKVKEWITTGDFYYTDLYSLTAIKGAAKAGNVQLLEKLIQHCHVDDSDRVTGRVTGHTQKMVAAMKGAAKGGHIVLVKEIIDQQNKMNGIIAAKSFFAQACENALKEGHFWLFNALTTDYPALVIVLSEKESSYAQGTHFNNLMEIALKAEQFEMVRKLQQYDTKNSYKNDFYDRGRLQTRTSSTAEFHDALSKLMKNTMDLTYHNKELTSWKTDTEYKSKQYCNYEETIQNNELLIAANIRAILNHFRFKFFANKDLQLDWASTFKSYLKELAVGEKNTSSYNKKEFVFDCEIYPRLHEKDGLINQAMKRYQCNPDQALSLSDNDLAKIQNTMMVSIRENLFKPNTEKTAAMDVCEDNIGIRCKTSP